MTAISRFVEGHPAILLAHVFVTAHGPEAIEFEVLEVNATSLHQYVGAELLLTSGDDKPFWGELVDLKPCTPTAPGLALLMDRSALKGTIKIYSGESNTLQ